MAQDINDNDYDFVVNGSHQYYTYYTNEDGDESTFALKPNDPNVITFIALAGEFAAADDLLAQESIVRVGYINDRSFYTKARRFGVGNVGMGRALHRGNPEVGTYTAQGCGDGLQPVNIKDDRKVENQDDTIDSQNRANYTAWQKDNPSCPNASASFDDQ